MESAHFKNLQHAQSHNTLSLRLNGCGLSCDTKTSKFFSHSFSLYNSEKLIRTLPNKSISTTDTSKNLENFIDSDFDRIHSATLKIRHVKSPSLQTKETSCTRPSVNVSYLRDDIF